MTKQKRSFPALLTALGAFCLAALFVFLGASIAAYASTDANGTNTNGEWQDGKTQNLIPAIQASDTWDTLTAKGWGKDSGTPSLEVAETSGHGYGIRPKERGSEADIGNDDFTGGDLLYHFSVGCRSGKGRSGATLDQCFRLVLSSSVHKL